MYVSTRARPPRVRVCVRVYVYACACGVCMRSSTIYLNAHTRTTPMVISPPAPPSMRHRSSYSRRRPVLCKVFTDETRVRRSAKVILPIRRKSLLAAHNQPPAHPCSTSVVLRGFHRRYTIHIIRIYSGGLSLSLSLPAFSFAPSLVRHRRRFCTRRDQYNRHIRRRCRRRRIRHRSHSHPTPKTCSYSQIARAYSVHVINMIGVWSF